MPATAPLSPIVQTKRNLRSASTTLFPIDEATADKFFAHLRAEVTVEEIGDIVRPLDGLARRVRKARADGRRWRS